MADEDWQARARAAGLETALQDFPDDVKAAVASAATAAAGIVAPADPRAEPWPPMRSGFCPQVGL